MQSDRARQRDSEVFLETMGGAGQGIERKSIGNEGEGQLAGQTDRLADTLDGQIIMGENDGIVGSRVKCTEG